MNQILNIPIIRLGQEEDPIKKSIEWESLGADGLYVLDLDSDTDAMHDANIDLMKEIVRSCDIPVYAGGVFHRFEDAKKYLYTGATKAVIYLTKETSVEELQLSKSRFGSDKLIYCTKESAILAGSDKERYQDITKDVLLLESEEKDTLINAGYNVWSNTQDVSCMSPKIMESKIAWSELTKNKDDLIPVVVQDYKNDEVLMVAYMNEKAFLETLATGRMTYWSRSRNELWVKGLISGHFQYVKELKTDCDMDTILAKVYQVGAACHTGKRSCFFREMVKKDYAETNPAKVFEDVYSVILDRRLHPKEGSYTNYLFDKGIDKILKKVGEEATEIVIAAKNPNPEEIKYEISDFLYHVMVLMAERGVTWEDITEELSKR